MGADDHDLLLYFDVRWLRKGADLLVLPFSAQSAKLA